MAITTARLKPGELVLICLRPGSDLPASSSGLHLVVRTSPHWALVVPASSLDRYRAIKVVAGDVLGVYAPAVLDAAALLRLDRPEIDLQTPPLAAALAVTEPEPEPDKLVVISVPDPNRLAYEFQDWRLRAASPRGKPAATIRLLARESETSNRSGEAKLVVDCPSWLVATFLNSVPGSHVPDRWPALGDP